MTTQANPAGPSLGPDHRTTPDDIAAAAERTIAVRTAVEPSVRLSVRYGVEVLLKREDRQLGRSYKVRGAYNVMSGLAEADLARGVVAASAGNHAQGVAISCARLGVDGHIVVPTNTPKQKRDRIVALGGDRVTLTLAGRSYDEASRAAAELVAASGATYVHPFDDHRTIAGQGTVAHELTDQVQALGGDPADVVLVPIGGGGLASGMATWLRHAWPGCRIVGVEPVGAASMGAALAAGEATTLAELDTFVDGASVGRVGGRTYPIVRDLVDEVVAVDVGAICTEMLELYSSEGIIAEPAGALATAALGAIDLGDARRVACVVSGGNNDVSRYAEVLERSLVHRGLRHYFLVGFPQQPGALRGFLDHVLAEGEDIVVFEYVKKSNRETGPALVGIDLDEASGLAALEDRMRTSNLDIERIPAGSPLFAFLL